MTVLPRLLVASEFPPNAGGGGPAVVRQMLKDWPVEKLFWWSCLPERDCLFGQRVAAHAVAAMPPKLFPHRRALALKSWLLEKTWTPWATNHLLRTLKKFRPEVIWVIPHQWAIPPLARVLLSSDLKFHVTMQDYMDSRGPIRRFGASRANEFARLAGQLYAKAATRDATSHPMIADLRARLGAEAAQMLHAGLEREDFEYLTRRPPNSTGQIRIVYAGSISVEPTFAHFIKALEAIRHRLPKPVSIEVFSAHSYRDREWFDASWMHERGNVPDPQFTNALRECDWGFAPMLLTEEDPGHFFSFPTKFISYLAAGLAIVTLGHERCSVVKMAESYRVGACVTSADLETLKSKLLEVFSLPDPWKVYGAEVMRCAQKEFDAARSREILYQCFRECAGKAAPRSPPQP